VFPGFSGAAKGSRRRARVEEECEVLGTHSDWCPSVQMFHSLTMLKEDKHDKGSWETWLGPMAVNLRELMHINLLYSANTGAPSAVVT